MNNQPKDIYEEYINAYNFKSSLGSKGLYEQSKINERFFVGDQWYGAKCGNERPLVRHNVIKRIGDYKMSNIAASPITVNFSADGIPNISGAKNDILNKRKEISTNPHFEFTGKTDEQEINLIMSALSDYRNVTANRIGLDALCAQLLKKAYISGTSLLYTYWDNTISTGLYAGKSNSAPINGDIICEVLDIENVYFSDPYLPDIQKQPFIIIAGTKDIESVKREALIYGADKYTLRAIEEESQDGKIMVLTKLFKEYKSNGEVTVKCIKVTEKSTVRKEYDTRLRLYPLAIFRWEERNNLVYGESEITYLIPNQIAINRMITANVWAAMTMGMPLMVVNGDTVSADVTNDPGQIIKIYGSNEDVAGAVKYVTPPDFCSNFSNSITSLIENTLTQSGANEVALGDSRPDNASALVTMRDAAVLPLQIIKNRYYDLIKQISRIWVDFWITQYGNRRIKIEDENGIWYLPFDAERYKQLYLTAKVSVGSDTQYGTVESINTLTSLYEKGVIDKRQFIKRIPDGIIPDSDSLLQEILQEEEK